MTALKLNLGAGPQQLDGWTRVDLSNADVCHDLSVTPWPFDNESASEILASHVLEHLDRAQGAAFVAECRRILIKGGVLHLAVPDMDKFIDCRLAGDMRPLGGYKWTSLDSLLGGGEQEPNVAYRHRYMYCYASLAYLMRSWWSCGRRNYPQTWDNPDHAAISLYVDAVK